MNIVINLFMMMRGIFQTYARTLFTIKSPLRVDGHNLRTLAKMPLQDVASILIRSLKAVRVMSYL